ncbi:MAG: hypothetical protein IKF06_00160 [Lachnospiraceae bacterium]|nr:hypothetical protein [Lachnospiraceae bacterium]
MQSRWKLKQFVSFILTACMALTFMPVCAMAEEAEAPDASVTVEMIHVDPSVNDIPEPANEPTTESPPGDPDGDDSEPRENLNHLSGDETPEAGDPTEKEVTPDTTAMEIDPNAQLLAKGLENLDLSICSLPTF